MTRQNYISGFPGRVLLVWIFVSVGFLFTVKAEKTDSIKNPILFNVNLHKGFIIAHYPELQPISSTYPQGIEATLAWHLLKQDTWKYCFCYPRTGVSLLYINYLNPKVLGSSLSAYLFIEPVVGAGRKWNGSFRFGIGPAYMTQVYDEETNPENVMYSSPLSFIVLLNAMVNYQASDRLYYSLSANYNHISNSGISEPNKGINFPTASLGLGYYIDAPQFIDWNNGDDPLYDEKNRFTIYSFATGKSARRGGIRYLVAGGGINYSRLVGRINAISLGSEYVFDGATQQKIANRELTHNGKVMKPDYLSMQLGHELILGRFKFQQQLGIYLYSPYNRKDPVYQRFGLSYNITRNIFLGINIKAHRHVADFMDFRVGYVISK